MATIKELKEIFISSISELYPSEEVQSFFNLLSEKYLGLSRIEIVLNSEMKISKNQLFTFEEAIQRLIKFEPIQYIIGETEFYGLQFLVDNNVLIPRPETEELVDWIVKDTNEKNEDRKDLFIANESFKTVLDIGTGSGCIAISLAHSLTNTNVSAIDISEGALQIAKQNSQLNKVDVNFEKADILNIDDDFSDMNFDVIVSNPPYVREQEKSQIEPNVIKHEPALALFVEDNDPLLFYRKIAQFSQKYLKNEGVLFFEINEYLSKELISMLKTEGFKEVILRKDIFGKARMIKCKK